MKKIIIIAILAICFTNVSAQGIQFFHGTFEEAKAKAKKENKKIFVDVFTTWCGPCKKMAKEVFPDKAVGDYFNANFVSMKLDAENEASHDFFKAYKANSYPTYFWVDAEGVLLDRQSGSSTPEGFIDMAKAAVGKSLGAEMTNLKARWDGGERNANLVREYVLGILPTSDPNAMYPAMIDYVSALSPEQQNSNETYQLLKGFCAPQDGYLKDDILTKIYLANIKENEKLDSKFSIDNRSMSSSLYRTFVRSHTSTYLKTNISVTESDKKIKAAVKYIRSLNFVYQEMYIECIEAEKLLYTKNYEKGIVKVEQIVAKYGANHPTLRGNLLYTLIMSGYYQQDKKPKIDAVVKLASENLSVMPSKTAVSYYAAAQYAAGNYKEAYSAMAWKTFYSDSDVSNAVWTKMNIENIRTKFPASTVETEAETSRIKALHKR